MPNELWETYSSFANTSGGCIILGVKEKEDKSWYMTGLKDVSKLKKEFFDSLHNKNKINISLVTDADVTDYEVDGDVILVIKVPKARREEKPIYINGDMWDGTYRRDWEGDYHCSREVILAMLRDQTEDTPDMKILENKEIVDFDQDSIKSYRNRYDAAHKDHPWTKLPDDEFLVRIGTASKETSDHRIHPTSAGLLMFGVYYLIMPEFANFLLDYYEKGDPTIRWTDRLASHNGDWSGNVYDFYTKVYMKIAPHLKKPFRLDGIYRIDDTPVHVAVREALVNCLSNADYFLSVPVKVELFPDRLVFSNPGTICTVVTLPLVEKDHLLSHKGDKKGDENAMKKEDEIKARADAALKAITANPQITVNELASTLSVSRKQTENALKRLKESGRIHREGSARNGKWIID